MREFALLAKAYTKVDVATAAAALGLAEADATEFCTQRNWTADAAAQVRDECMRVYQT